MAPHTTGQFDRARLLVLGRTARGWALTRWSATGAFAGDRSAETIYVRLLGEAVDVWRPVNARPLGDDVFAIREQPYDRADERWEFPPGALVVCELTHLEDGPVMVAIAPHAPGPRAPG